MRRTGHGHRLRLPQGAHVDFAASIELLVSLKHFGLLRLPRSGPLLITLPLRPFVLFVFLAEVHCDIFVQLHLVVELDRHFDVLLHVPGFVFIRVVLHLLYHGRMPALA